MGSVVGELREKTLMETKNKYGDLRHMAMAFDAAAFEKELPAVGEMDDETVYDFIAFMCDSFYDNVLKRKYDALKPRIPEATALEGIRKILSLLPFDEKAFGNGLRYCGTWGEGGQIVPLLMEYPIPAEYVEKAIADAKANNMQTTLKALERYKEGAVE